MLGLPADQIIGKERSSFFTGRLGETQKAGLQRVFGTGREARTEGPMQVAGEERWFDHYLIPISDNNGDVISVLGISRDITDRLWPGKDA